MRIIMALLASASLFGLAACDDGDDDKPPDKELCQRAKQYNDDWAERRYCEYPRYDDRYS